MAVYRFKVSFEDYDDVMREIDIKSNQTFEDLHRAIHKSTGYDAEKSSSFYICNDHWIKSDEIAYMPSNSKIERGVVIMTNARLSNYIDDPHQKFYYTYNFERPFDFHVELIKISLNDELGKEYPFVVKSAGEVPKIVTGFMPTALPPNSEDFDFLNEMGFTPEDTEELAAMSDAGINADEEQQHDEEDLDEEKDEFIDEFSDNENYDADDYQKEDV